MQNSGIADPYWFEWYVGLEKIIDMIDPESGIEYVIFQSSQHGAVDDVVVGYKNKQQEVCYQAKHEISTSASNNLTFGKLLSKDPKSSNSLLESLADGWKNSSSTGISITPVLYTNRSFGPNRSIREYEGMKYRALSLGEFFLKVKEELAGDIQKCKDRDFLYQWKELAEGTGLSDKNEIIDFIKALRINTSMPSLLNAETNMIRSLSNFFKCSEPIAEELFSKLIYELRIWTTTRRDQEKITIEDIYSVLSFETDTNESQHRLIPPYPFFNSRKCFCDDLIKTLEGTSKKIILIYGSPGTGKTSIISYLQSEFNLFLLRYHTFRPISPEQQFYNADEGLFTADNLWGTFLIQLRQHFKGNIAEHKIPLNNKFCDVTTKRSEVLRLFSILGQEAVLRGIKYYICIDGIDHAARSNCNITFLSSLFLPSEIPDGICFIIVGQPLELYESLYPVWFRNNSLIHYINIPDIEKPDISQLVQKKIPHFYEQADDIAEIIFQYTQGNNLSVVFAVEQIRGIHSIEELIATLKSSGICSDIQQYYHHLWTYIKKLIIQMGLNEPFPESIVACPIVLLNGRVNTIFLSDALSYGLKSVDWNQIFDKLYPLVIKLNENEYALFHNDFRVFLMDIISSYSAKYREIALKLAEYLLDRPCGLSTYISGIPLLVSAERKDIIPNYFSSAFVIGALAEGISKSRLDDYAHMAYTEVCHQQDKHLYIQVYLAIKTLHQHIRYYEYYDRQYKSSDHPILSNIDINEVRVLPLNNETLAEYLKVISLCKLLFVEKDKKERALSLYDKWLHLLTPQELLNCCAAHFSDEDAWDIRNSKVGDFLIKWGDLAATLEIELPQKPSSPNKALQIAYILYSESYFNTSFDLGYYNSSIDVVRYGFVTLDCIKKQLPNILYMGLISYFSDMLEALSAEPQDFHIQLFSTALLAFSGKKINSSFDLQKQKTIKHIYDENCFIVVLYSFIMGYSESKFDELLIIGHAKKIIEGLEDEKKDITQINKIISLACVLGKCHADFEHQIHPQLYKETIHWFLTNRLWRQHDYRKAHTFLLYMIFNNNSCNKWISEFDLIFDADYHLNKIDQLGMFYKTHILDFLKKQNQFEIIKKYIMSLYGVNGELLYLNENYAEMHSRFSPYGNTVCPALMKSITDKLKWDVVNYVGSDEDALEAPYNYLDSILTRNPEEWSIYGQIIYNQSLLANIFSNRYHHLIVERIGKGALQNSLQAFGEFLNWDKDIRMDMNFLHHFIFDMIDVALNEKDLKSIWILSCGTHSWYLSEDHHSIKSIYEACLQRAKILGINIESQLVNLTPEWLKIISYRNKPKTSLGFDGYQDDSKKLATYYSSMDVNQIIAELPLVINERHAEKHFEAIILQLDKRDAFTSDTMEHFISALCKYLENKEWKHYSIDDIITFIIGKGNSDTFWKLARIIGNNLSDYNYHTSIHNMLILLGISTKYDTDKIPFMLEQELATQEQWVTGCGHIIIRMSVGEELVSAFQAPSSFSDLALNVLLEQLRTNNARKMESALLGIRLLCEHDSDVLQKIGPYWTSFNNVQKEMIFVICAYWSRINLKLFNELYDVLNEEYLECNHLTHKYYLHSIKNYVSENNSNTEMLSLSALPIEYNLPNIYQHNFKKDTPNNVNRFLHLTEVCLGQHGLNNDIHQCILDKHMEMYDAKEDKYARIGDSNIAHSNKEIYANELLYGEERKGRWKALPLLLKKQFLLPADDPFVLSRMPTISFDNSWMAEERLGAALTSKDAGETNSIIWAIMQSDCDPTKEVLGACVWFPFSYKKGVIVYRIGKVDFGFSTKRDNNISQCLGNYGLTITEGCLNEINNGDLKTSGTSLFSINCGGMYFVHGNCQLSPSSIWENHFDCSPSTNPMLWNNAEGIPILFFERIASPFRESRQELYFRQPILFRWVCDKSWLKKQLKEKGLRLRYVQQKEYFDEAMPNMV